MEGKKMNEQYTVIRSFQDKYTNQSYKVGESFSINDPQRAKELEGGGYIAGTNTVSAKDAMAQAQNTQANAQKMAQESNKTANSAEPKTVLNGKVVQLKFAQAAESAFDESNRTSGVQKHHDNTSESVPAGQIASRSQSTAESAEVQAAQQTIKQGNVQSSQAHLEQHLQQAQQQGQQAQQQNTQPQQAEQQALAAAAEKTNPMAAEHETAAEMQQAAAEHKAKARAKKE